MKNSNYITIQGWMINELELSSNELLCYSIIYGFCQDGENEFTGSLKYICDSISISKPTAIKILNSLVEKDLIIKRQFEVNGVVFNTYKINLQVVKNLNWGGKETLLGGSKETLPNNSININNTNKYNTNNIDERKQKFWESLEEFTFDLGNEKENFFTYWVEPSKKNRMRFEDEKYFDIKRRINTWISRSKNNKFTKQPELGPNAQRAMMYQKLKR